MKKILKKVMIVFMCVCLVWGMCGCTLVTDTIGKFTGANLDYDKIIESFVSDGLNTTELAVGQEDKPNSAIWLEQGIIKGKVYCDNEQVVQVTDLGKVTAVGPGTAHVVISTIGGMYDVHRYIVY